MLPYLWFHREKYSSIFQEPKIVHTLWYNNFTSEDESKKFKMKKKYAGRYSLNNILIEESNNIKYSSRQVDNVKLSEQI